MSIHWLLSGGQLLDTSLPIVAGISSVLEGNCPLVDAALRLPCSSPWPVAPAQHRQPQSRCLCAGRLGSILSGPVAVHGHRRVPPPAVGHRQDAASKEPEGGSCVWPKLDKQGEGWQVGSPGGLSSAEPWQRWRSCAPCMLGKEQGGEMVWGAKETSRGATRGASEVQDRERTAEWRGGRAGMAVRTGKVGRRKVPTGREPNRKRQAVLWKGRHTHSHP